MRTFQSPQKIVCCWVSYVKETYVTTFFPEPSGNSMLIVLYIVVLQLDQH